MRVAKLLTLASILVLGFLQSYPVAAVERRDSIGEPIQIFGVTQQDLNGDGKPDVTLIECDFASAQDQVLVYDQNGDMPTGSEWQEITDFQDDVWIFDVGADGSAQLVVVFHRGADGLVADLYDDGDGDGEVHYGLQGSTPLVTENGGKWSLRVIARDGWWTQGGTVNFNLDLLVDGVMKAAYVDDLRLPLVNAGLLKTDGTLDYEVYVRDVDRDGKPDYEWRQNRYPLPEDPRVSGHVRTEISANTQGDEPLFQEGVFWPFLSLQVGSYVKSRAGPPPIQVDWGNASIAQIAEFVRSSIEPGNYRIYSRVRVLEGETTTTDFENPFAMYDLAQAGDGYPDLNIRFGIVPPSSNEASGLNATPLNDIQYVWDQYHVQHWDYQVALAGRQAIDEVVEFPEFSVRMVPYAQLPEWVTSQIWDVATFVQVEKSPFYNSEIVWEWNTTIGSDAVRREYLAGISDAPPVDDFAGLAVGLRGEYAFDYDSTPVLYFSPVDSKLHLLKAQAGTFRLDENRTIRYLNLGGDYINRWTLLEDDQPVQTLFFDSGWLISDDHTTLRLARSEVPPYLFTTLPPRNHDEWAKLGADLEQKKPTFAPDDFEAMFAQFDSPAIEIEGAALRDCRVTPQGFRFILDLQPGFSIVSDHEGWGSRLTAAGAHAVSFDGAAWDIRPSTPAAVGAGELVVGEPGQPLRALDWTPIELLLENDGLEDAHDLAVKALLSGPAAEQQVLTTMVSLLPAEGSQQVTWDWSPPVAGAWQVRIEADSAQGSAGGLPSQVLVTAELYVQPPSVPSPQWLLSLGSATPPAILTLLGGLAVLASATAAVWATGGGLRSQR